MKKSVLAILAFLFSIPLSAQNRPKVGLVLSGGGAKGLAHVGVLKILEENNIPIDYIVGTSMGGIVGGFYAAGYNADEIEKIVSAPDFQEWAFGKLGTNHKFIHPKDEENASFVSFQVQIDSALSTTFQSNIVNDAPLNFALGQYLYIPIKEANYNFDSLNIPFRCMAADIFTQSEVILKKGSLSDALRTTMAVPLVFRAIQIDDRYMYDGGLYNNFPADVMRSEFNPDIIIGVNVSAKVYDDYPYDDDDEMIKSPLKFLFLDNSDLGPLKDGDIYIEPVLEDISPGSFEKVEDAIQRGVDATMTQLDSIKKSITFRLEEKRPSNYEKFTAFDDKVFGEVEITGLNSVQKEHVRKILASRKSSKKKEMSILELREGYYRLISDNYFNDVYPKISYDSAGFYRFSLDVNSNQKAALELGGNLSSRSISAGFVGVKFSLLDKLFYNFSLSGFTGRFYTSGRALGKITFPTYNPFYIEAEATFNNWEYSNINELIFKKNDVALVDRVDRFIGLEAGRNIGERNTISIRGGYGNNEDLYFNTDDFSVLDEVDETSLDIWLGELKYLRTTLDRKKFASSGEKIAITGKVFTGKERLRTGTTSLLSDGEFNRDWTQLKLEYERYYGQKVKLGLMSELSLSTQPKFANYKATLINAPAFYPLLDSRTLFLEDFRAFSYVAGGTRLVFPITKDALDFRIEGYGFLPYRRMLEGANQQVVLGKRFQDPEFAGTASLVYHTPFGPISASLNYYSDDNYRFGVLFNVGYLLFNNRVLGD